MIDVKTQIVETLSEILPTYYELFCDSTTTKPCITYRQVGDYQGLTGETIMHSEISYDIKLWGKVIHDLMDYVGQIDDKMRQIGFKRIAYNELSINDDLELILTYNGRGLEIE